MSQSTQKVIMTAHPDREEQDQETEDELHAHFILSILDYNGE